MGQRVKLPAGKIGVFFAGSPPRVDQVSQDSPISSQVQVGQYAASLIVKDLEVTNVHSAESLVDLLIKYAGTERFLVVEDSPPQRGPTTYAVVIPPGTLGVTFQGCDPTTIVKISPASPIANIVKFDQILERLLIPGEPPMEGQVTGAKEFVEALGQHSSLSGRKLILSDPGTQVRVTSPMDTASTSVVAPIIVQTQRAGDVVARIEGAETQVIHITMNPGQKILAEPSTMIYMSEDVEMNTSAGGGGFGRWITGSKVFMTEFVYFGQRQGTVCFGPKFPSKIVSLRLEDYGGKIICQRGTYLCSTDSVSVVVEFAGSLGTAFFGGEGFILQGITGRGQLFLDGSGTIITKKLAPNERLRVSPGSLMAFEKSVRYDIQTVGGGFGNALFGGHGFFLTTLTGPGTVWLEGAPIDNIVKEIASRLPKR